MVPPRPTRDREPSGRLRIVAGEHRGRRLHSPDEGADAEARPTTARAREAVFSMLGPLGGEPVLDLFCGTGAMGLEALSRGASEATLVDLDTSTAIANVELLGLADRCRVVRGDALDFLSRPEADGYELVFCDPPYGYRLADRLGDELDKLVAERLPPGARLVVESPAREPLRLRHPAARERRYGAAMIALHEAPDA